ncbi:Lambda-crystallin -like protein [Sarcoptes scabiei]|uniref:Lambda-crystallin -like protein n=1 Tax=Sarcoptes scabiei TaxID=52283 RepID=A0A132AI22_SARSC|nr:Lambda-crystallin -like protein [Sarcoptes scabiei]KPM10459.1 lambda-crystallin-like protein [Sarcoptes scabiei]
MASKIGIIGSGLIGQSWTMIFISKGYEVFLYDVVAEQIDIALKCIEEKLKNLEKRKALRGELSAQNQFKLIHKASSLKECIENAIHVQECVFEQLDLKIKLFKQLDEIYSSLDSKIETIFCSSTSCFLPSLLFNDLMNNSRMIVGHPVNPPYFAPLVEVVPSKWTDQKVVEQTRKIFDDVGQKPVILKKEKEGFVLNRIQYAILNECYRLIEEEVISVADIDSVMSNGLGLRYAFMGPWETAHLNANGLGEYFDKYAKGIYDVSETFGPVPRMQGDTAQSIAKEMTKQFPLDRLNERRQWRDERLIELACLKRDSESH